MTFFVFFYVMQTKKPNALTEEIIVSFVKPPVVEELGRIGSFENKKRISVKGEVTTVSVIFIQEARLCEVVEKVM